MKIVRWTSLRQNFDRVDNEVAAAVMMSGFRRETII
jgi:hypothetical protein